MSKPARVATWASETTDHSGQATTTAPSRTRVGTACGVSVVAVLVDPLRDHPDLHDSHLVASVRGDLLERAGRPGEAAAEYQRAADLTGNAAERRLLQRRAEALRPAPGGPDPDTGPTLGEAADEFLAGLPAATARSYAQTLTRLRRDLGDDVPLEALDAERITRLCTAAWGTSSPRTWNRHRAALRAFLRRAADHWGVEDRTEQLALPRRDVPPPHDASLPPEGIRALCADPRFGLRDRALWSLLAESGAAVSSVLALDVDDLDLDDREARTDGGCVRWRGRTARLLAELVDGRGRGPVFLSDRRPAPARPTAEADLCPETGRRRLSYERAEYLFKRASGSVGPASTLRCLRTRG